MRMCRGEIKQTRVSKSPYPPKCRPCVVQNVSSRYPESLRSSRSTGPLTAPRKACPIRIRPGRAQLVNQTVARGAGQARRDAPAERKCSQKERRPSQRGAGSRHVRVRRCAASGSVRCASLAQPAGDCGLALFGDVTVCAARRAMEEIKSGLMSEGGDFCFGCAFVCCASVGMIFFILYFDLPV